MNSQHPRPSLQPETLRAVTTELEAAKTQADRVREQMPSAADVSEIEALRAQVDRALLMLAAQQSELDEVRENTARMDRPSQVVVQLPAPPVLPSNTDQSTATKALSKFPERYKTAILALLLAATNVLTNLGQWIAREMSRDDSADERRERRPKPPRPPPRDHPPG